MFELNDKALLTTRKIAMVVIGIFAVLSLVFGIVMAVAADWWWFFITFALWFLCWLAWVVVRLHLSYLCDIKLVRNRLYGESNEGLEMFLKAREERSTSPEIQERKKAVGDELEHLQQLLNSGVITEEEYKKRESELTKGE